MKLALQMPELLEMPKYSKLNSLLTLNEIDLEPKYRKDKWEIVMEIRLLPDEEVPHLLNAQSFRVRNLAAKEMCTRNMRNEIKYHFENGNEDNRRILRPYIEIMKIKTG